MFDVILSCIGADNPFPFSILAAGAIFPIRYAVVMWELEIVSCGNWKSCHVGIGNRTQGRGDIETRE